MTRDVPMAGPDGGWERVLASLASGPTAAPLLDLRRNAALVWSAAVDTLLWASVDVLPAGWISGSGEVSGMPPDLVARLRALASGLAPSDGFRLERFRLGPGRLAPPTTIACRRLEGHDALLTLLLGRGASSAAEGGSAAPDAPAVTASADSPGLPAVAPVPDSVGRRFTWQADAAGRFTAVSGDLPDLLGADGGALLGRAWRDLVGERLLDEAGAVAAAMAAARPWTRAPIGWRAETTGRVVPVLLSGVPLRRSDGLVAGWRGFGLAYPDAERACPAGFAWREAAPADQTPPAGESPPGPDEHGAPAPDLQPILGEAIEVAAALTGSAGDAMFGVIRALLGPKNAASDPDSAEHVPAPASGGLSGPERGALHEIARALGARIEGEPEPGRPTAEIVPLPVRPRDPDPGGLLDRVPIGLVVLRDGLPLFANRHLLDQLDGADLPALVARGSLQPILDAAARAGEAGRASPLTLPGSQAASRVSVAPVSWGELPASLVALLPVEAPATVDQARALALDLSRRDERVAELRRGLDLAADGAAMLDGTARILWLSRSAEGLFGYTAAELAGDSVVALLPAADHRAALGCLEDLRSEPPETVRTVEVRLRSPAGASRPLAMRAARIPDREAGGFVVTFHDLSRLKALEEELRSARQSAERSTANQADFLARVSHEIRTPITAITGFAELMMEERFGPIGSERYRGYVRDIHGSGEHVVSLVNDLLDLAKVAAGKSDLTPASVDLNAVVQQCVKLAMPLSTRERTIVRTSFPADLPPILADERSVRQVALNILTNAIRYTGAGGQVIVSTRLGTAGEIVLAVRDTGPGMEPDEIEAALTPFQQVAHTRRVDGTGLGLPLSKALVEANGGNFKLTSSRSAGTLVEIRFPAAPPPRPETIAAE